MAKDIKISMGDILKWTALLRFMEISKKYINYES